MIMVSLSPQLDIGWEESAQPFWSSSGVWVFCDADTIGGRSESLGNCGEALSAVASARWKEMRVPFCLQFWESVRIGCLAWQWIWGNALWEGARKKGQGVGHSHWTQGGWVIGQCAHQPTKISHLKRFSLTEQVNKSCWLHLLMNQAIGLTISQLPFSLHYNMHLSSSPTHVLTFLK